MAVSFASIDPTEMELTPMRVSFKGPTASSFSDLGGTLGNVVIKMAYKKSAIHADQFGKTVLDERVSSIDITVTTELAEVQDKALWKILFPHATQGIGTGGFTGQSIIDFNSAIGDGSLSNAGALRLHPLSKPDSDTNTDYNFGLACSTAESEITYSAEGQAKMKIVWMIFPDTTVTPATFMSYGNPSLT